MRLVNCSDCVRFIECAVQRKHPQMHGAHMRRRSLYSAALVATLAWLNAAAQTPIPLEYFTKYDEFSGMKLSPDGQFVALHTGKYGRSALLFVDLKNKKIASGIRAPQNGEIDDYYWISPTRL